MFWQELSKFGQNTAFIDSENSNSVTYLQLEHDIENFLNRFSMQNVICLILIKNNYPLIVSYLSLLNSSNTIMLLNENTNEDFLKNILLNYNPEVVISQTILNFKNYINEEILFPFGNIFVYKKSGHYKNISSNTKLMLSTSGSTGSSKFVRLSSKNIDSNAASIANYLRIDPSERAITSLPINYSFGLSIINSHLLSGASIVLTDESLIQKKFWNIFKKFNCTTFSGVPYSFQILQRIKLAEMQLPSLKYFTQAGGHLVSTTKEYFLMLAKKRNYEFVVMYGQTEATARISYVPFYALEYNIDSIGVAIPNGKLTVIDSVESNEGMFVGELVYEGPNVMLGYAEQREDIFKEDELGGKLFTGDMGYMNENGYYFVTGRKKRFIKLFGNRINLDDIERYAENSFKVNCAVTGNDEKLQILLENSTESDTKWIKENLSKMFSIHHSAIKIKSVDMIPVSSNSKKNYQEIKKLF
ncbi:MAG: AMP-binding protein [Ignavibacteriae bacterium]|nr:AMP-binding protein [Ignavibacteriota bacterium]